MPEHIPFTDETRKQIEAELRIALKVLGHKADLPPLDRLRDVLEDLGASTELIAIVGSMATH